LWLRWSELGLKMVRLTEDPAPRRVELKPWRGARLPAPGWPWRLQQGHVWPWEAEDLQAAGAAPEGF
jgi:hypothetical protein